MLSKCWGPGSLTQFIFCSFLIVFHRRVFMFQFWKSITWWRVSSTSSATVWVFSKDSRWPGILLLRPICTLPLLISVPILFNYSCTCSTTLHFLTEMIEQAFHACCYRKLKAFSSCPTITSFNVFTILYIENQSWRVVSRWSGKNCFLLLMNNESLQKDRTMLVQ